MRQRARDGLNLSRRFSAASRKARGGFALVVVIWGLGVISLLIVGFLTTARLRLRVAAETAGIAQAEFSADAVANSTILALVQQGPTAPTVGAFAAQPNIAAPPGAGAGHDGAPTLCAFEGSNVVVAVEDEGGKVDLNLATPKLLQALFVGVGQSPQQADALASAIIAYRTPALNDFDLKDQGYEDRPFGPKHGLFQTILELDQTPGMDPALFALVSPLITAHAHRAGVDATNSPPALFAALAGYDAKDVLALLGEPFPNAIDRSDPRLPAEFRQGGSVGVFLIHVEARAPTGQIAVRDMIVDTHPAADPSGRLEPYAIREVRRGARRYPALLAARASSAC